MAPPIKAEKAPLRPQFCELLYLQNRVSNRDNLMFVAVVVAESGGAQVFRLGCIDHSLNSHQSGPVLVATDSFDVTSKESNHEVEGPTVKDCGLRAEIESPRAAGGSQVDDKLHDGNIQNGEDCSSTKFYWSRAMTRALVDGYRTLAVEFRKPEKRQRDVWESLAVEMRREGFVDVTWEMCDRKWRNLKNTFKTIYYSNRPIHGRRRWEFYDEFKVLFAPDVRGKRVERESRTISPRVSFQSCGGFTRNIENTSATLEQPRWFSEFSSSHINRYRTKLELARQGHNRRIIVARQTCELLERLVDSI